MKMVFNLHLIEKKKAVVMKRHLNADSGYYHDNFRLFDIK